MDRSANGNQNVGSDFAEKFSYLFEGLLSEFSEETGYDLGTYFFYDWKRDQLVEVNSKDYLKYWSICSAIPDQNRENYISTFSMPDPGDGHKAFRQLLSENNLSHITNSPRPIESWIQQWNAPYSKLWFIAEFALLLKKISQSDPDRAVDYAFQLGKSFTEYKWKSGHSGNVSAGIKNLRALDAAERAKPLKAAKRRSATLDCIARLWHEARNELGPNGMRMDTNAAQAIYARAEKERPSELIIKKSGKVKGPDAIRRLLPELRVSGKID